MQRNRVPKIKPFNTLFKKKRSRAAVRRAGDQARDAERWSEAAAHYADFLQCEPSNVMIRVQLGNCLKEAGRHTEALAAYDLAIALDDKHDDAHLQRGHLLKKMGRVSQAAWRNTANPSS